MPTQPTRETESCVAGYIGTGNDMTMITRDLKGTTPQSPSRDQGQGPSRNQGQAAERSVADSPLTNMSGPEHNLGGSPSEEAFERARQGFGYEEFATRVAFFQIDDVKATTEFLTTPA
jgi:hypothetical protein